MCGDLDAILGHPFKVLDDGFVRVVDYMGSDESIVQAARVSYGKGTKTVLQNEGLIRYLMRHQHTTPFEMCEIKLHVRVPMDCWRQWARHRTANVNEYSTRYSEAIDEAHRTGKGQWRRQSKSNRQGSSGYLDPGMGDALSRREEEIQKAAREVYEERLEKGVAREQARKDLPLSTYTEAYWKVDLHNLFHFLQLRMDERAQLEIRNYATTIGNEIVRQWCPIAWQAFVDYRLESLVLTRIEKQVVELLAAGKPKDATEKVAHQGWLVPADKGWKRSRERAELEEKLAGLSMPVPWMETP